MKRLLLPLLTLLLPALPSLAQTVPNGGFENWTTSGATESPTGWLTMDQALVGQGLPFQLNFVTKSTDRQAGSFAAKLESRTIPIPIPIPGLGGYLPSIMLIGNNLDLDDAEAAGGVPFTSRPGSVRFWYKLTLAPNDTAGAFAGLVRGPRATQQTIGAGALELTPSTTFRQAAFNIEYNPGTLAPDTLRMGFVVGTGNAAASSSLIVDEITFGSRVLSSKAARQLATSLSVYPNPSSTGEFALASLDHPAVATAPLTVTDALGRTVLRAEAVAARFSNGRSLDLHHQPPGVYTLRLETPEGPVTRRLIIR
ncbi:T9SS type A sorting domain-containing protein [Hymenobacter coalescens]